MRKTVTVRRAARIALPILVLAIMTASIDSARADRHCTAARESAFYARDISADALKANAAQCPAKMAEAMSRLRESMEGLNVCWCDPARIPLQHWFDSRPSGGIDPKASCRESATAINRIAKSVLRQVEECF